MTSHARPDFELLARFVADLREEADWLETIHSGDDKPGGTGQAASDARRMRKLADQVEILDGDSRRLGRNLGYLPSLAGVGYYCAGGCSRLVEYPGWVCQRCAERYPDRAMSARPCKTR
jgi:hypothetical protein